MSTFATADDPVWREVAPEIRPGELNAPYEMAPEFLRVLSKIRRDCHVPFRFVSDARDPEGTVGAANSAHKERPCRACDLRVLNNAERFALIFSAHKHGIRRFGVYPPTPAQIRMFGAGAGSVHLDMSESKPQGRMWMSW